MNVTHQVFKTIKQVVFKAPLLTVVFSRIRRLYNNLFALGVALLLALTLNTTAIGAPQGENIVAGDASIHRDGNVTTIHQTSNKAAINWNTFNIGAGERTHFNQPNASSITLNRVTGGHGGI